MSSRPIGYPKIDPLNALRNFFLIVLQHVKFGKLQQNYNKLQTRWPGQSPT